MVRLLFVYPLKCTHHAQTHPSPLTMPRAPWGRLVAPLSLPRGICSSRYRKLANNSVLRVWCRWKDRLWRHMDTSVFFQRSRWAWWRAWNSMLGGELEDTTALFVSSRLILALSASSAVSIAEIQCVSTGWSVCVWPSVPVAVSLLCVQSSPASEQCVNHKVCVTKCEDVVASAVASAVLLYLWVWGPLVPSLTARDRLWSHLGAVLKAAPGCMHAEWHPSFQPTNTSSTQDTLPLLLTAV